MNILVRPYGSKQCYVRPDTTWERENRDFYSPECVNEYHWTPVVFARVSKAGKFVSPKFVSRYYDGFSFGALLYIGDDVLFGSCADHTSILPSPLYNPVVMENEDNTFTAYKNGEEIFSGKPCKELIEESICLASQRTSLRIGDFVAVELSPLSLLSSKEEGQAALCGKFCENDLFDFKIIY